MRHTKIIATLGPASDSVETIRALVDAGVDVFRLNFSHGRHGEHRTRFERIRVVEAERGRPLAVMMDLQGPKLRIGTLVGGRATLKAGEGLRLDLNPDDGDARRVCLGHPELLASLREGVHLLIDDGRIRLRVTRADGTSAQTLIEQGGVLQDRKGVNLPNAPLLGSVVTPKDWEDLAFGLALGVDWVAMSFVQSAADIAELKSKVRGRARVIAKIEKPQAVENLSAIADAADALMIARGDLAVEMSTEEVPVLQRRIVRECRLRGKPVIVATQMLESMTGLPVPTRAEASDVATAVYQGADAVMLSAETASGDHPLDAVRVMDRIVRHAEADPGYRQALKHMVVPLRIELAALGADVIGSALQTVSEATTLAATVSYTTSGASALKMARERPRSPLVGVTPSTAVARALALVWGVVPYVSAEARGADDMLDVALAAVRRCVPAAAEGSVAVVGGLPFGTPGTTNFIHVVDSLRAG
jgi:pyruvate kinase